MSVTFRQDQSIRQAGSVPIPGFRPERASPFLRAWRSFRVTEQIAGAFALIGLLPVIAAVAFTIAVLSRRSPLVSHLRVGLNGAPLDMLKFRTMWERDGTPGPLFSIDRVGDTAPALKAATDPRITSRFAAFCRRHSLDELPQFFHVAVGQMSLVGPRPITRRELELHYGASADEVLSVRPGMTGLWQVTGRNRLSYSTRRRLDLLFVRKASGGLYFAILARTILRVVSGVGAF